MHKQVLVGEDEAGLRADVFLSKKLKEYSRSSLKKLFDNGYVSLGGTIIEPSEKLKLNQMLDVNISRLVELPPITNLPVIFEDKDVVVINKPEGVLTHSKGAFNEEMTVADFIRPYITDKLLLGNRAGIVHRLDRRTSGVIICAKNSQAITKLQRQFSLRKTKKIYLAVSEGIIEPDEAIIDIPLQRSRKNPKKFTTSEYGKPSQTKYRVIKYLDSDKTLVELKPLTGRTHQLRVHLKYIGHPIVGDDVYGIAGDHLMLHAKSLEITLPSGDRRIFEAKVPDYWNAYV